MVVVVFRADGIPAATGGVPLPARPQVEIEVVVGGAGSVSTSVQLNGPGDVIGLDPTVIVAPYRGTAFSPARFSMPYRSAPPRIRCVSKVADVPCRPMLACKS